MKIPKVVDKKSARIFLRWAIKTVGMGFHPDTGFDDYVVCKTGERTFSKEDAYRCDIELNAAFLILDGNTYAVALAEMKKIQGELK